MKFSERLKDFRKQNNITQQELADKLFVSRSAIAKWEQDRGLPSEDILQKISELIGIPIEELIPEKELRAITIENNNKLNRQKFNFKVLFSILLASIILLSIVFSVVLTGLKNDNPPPKEGSATAFCRAEVHGEILTLENHKAPLVFSVNVNLNDTSIEYLDKYGYPSSLKNVKTGYKLKFAYTYSEDQEQIRTFGKVTGIYLIDDYVHGELITKGFFLSTSEYTGDKVPIYCPNFDYMCNDYAETINGIIYGSEYRFPYFLVGDKNLSYARLVDVIERGETISTSPYTEQIIRQSYSLSINVSDRVETIYVYAVDNSEKGYREYHRFDKTDFIHMEGQILHLNWYDADHHAYKTEVTINLYVHFVPSSSIVIDEFNKSGELVKSTYLYTYEQANSLPYFITEDGVRFVRVSNPGEGNGFIYAVGESFTISLPTDYGYMQSCTIKLL